MIEFFNYFLMEIAREAAGLSQKALADAIGCTQATISRWERGLFKPSEQGLALMCALLRVSPEFFVQEKMPLGGGLPTFYHRSLAAASANTTARVNARCTLISMQVEALCKIRPIEADDFPNLPADQMTGGATAVAQALRAKWGLGPGPVHDLVGLIERKGGLVVVEDLGCDEVDALCWWRSGLPKLFFVNARKPACRMRFSLAHELGHTVMHTDPTDTALAEREADAFAGEFLLPQKEARAYLLPPVNLARLASAKTWWKMSMAALAVRAKECGVITSEQLSGLMKELGARGWRKREPVELPHEMPTTFARMLRYPLDSLDWTVAQLAAAMFTTENELRRLLGSNLSPQEQGTETGAPFLRLVGH